MKYSLAAQEFAYAIMDDMYAHDNKCAWEDVAEARTKTYLKSHKLAPALKREDVKKCLHSIINYTSVAGPKTALRLHTEKMEHLKAAIDLANKWHDIVEQHSTEQAIKTYRKYLHETDVYSAASAYWQMVYMDRLKEAALARQPMSPYEALDNLAKPVLEKLLSCGTEHLTLEKRYQPDHRNVVVHLVPGCVAGVPIAKKYDKLIAIEELFKMMRHLQFNDITPYARVEEVRWAHGTIWIMLRSFGNMPANLVASACYDLGLSTAYCGYDAKVNLLPKGYLLWRKSDGRQEVNYELNHQDVEQFYYYPEYRADKTKHCIHMVKSKPLEILRTRERYMVRSGRRYEILRPVFADLYDEWESLKGPLGPEESEEFDEL